MSSTLVGVVLCVVIFYVLRTLWTRKESKPVSSLPPGPQPMPLLGNIRDLPPAGAQDWMHWVKHKAQYGPISSVTVMGQTIVILNKGRIATELLGKRSALHSSRPKMVFASEMVGWEHILAMQTYSDRFRAYRKAMQPYLGSASAVAQFNPLQEVEAHRFLLRTLKDPKSLAQHIQTEAGAVILKIAYGYTIEPHTRDPLVHIANLALEHFSIAGTPGTWLVDIIPALKYLPAWLPGAGFKRTAQAWKANLENVVEKPYALVRQQMDNGKYEPSYLSDLFKTRYPPAQSEEELVAKWTAGSLYTGGADTTVCAIESFFLAMTVFPDVQRKAQEEIDRVLGPGQLPKVADRQRLPFVSAVVKEVLRWHPVAPMGIPHMSSEDDTWGEYFIPKGSLIMPNIWAFTHDPEVYKDPMEFRPERFLGEEPEEDPTSYVFGFGRRVCPGRFLADNTLYLSVAQSLAVFRIEGTEVKADANFQPGVISHPIPWKHQITTRSADHEALILSVEQEHPWTPSDAPSLETLAKQQQRHDLHLA